MTTIAGTWRMFVRWLRAEAPDVAANLKPPTKPPRGVKALPPTLEALLAIHDGGKYVFGGADFLSREEIVARHKRPDPHRRLARGYVPFAADSFDDLLMLDPKGRVVDAPHDDAATTVVASSLEAWLTRVVEAVEATDIRYGDDGAISPTSGSDCFRLLADRRYVVLERAAPVTIEGPADLTVTGIEGPNLAGLSFELTEGKTKRTFDVGREARRQNRRSLSLIAPVLRIKARATLRVSGLAGTEAVWIHFKSRSPVLWKRTKPSAYVPPKRLAKKKPSPPALETDFQRLGLGEPHRGVLDAPPWEAAPVAEIRATLSAEVKRLRKSWGAPKGAAAKKTYEALLRAWDRGGGKTTTPEIDAALATIGAIWPDARENLDRLVKVWFADGGAEGALTRLVKMADFSTKSAGYPGLATGGANGYLLPVAALIARELADPKAARPFALELRKSAPPSARIALTRAFLDPDWALEDAKLDFATLMPEELQTLYRAATDAGLKQRLLAHLKATATNDHPRLVAIKEAAMKKAKARLRAASRS